MTILISTRGLTKQYGKKSSLFTALNNIDFSINQGESVAIIGKSGSGKSTLMHLLALLDTPTSGKVLFGNKDTSEMKSKQLDKLRNKTFGFVFQQFFLNSNNSVLENVILPLKISGLGKKTRIQRGLEVLEDVELADKAYSKANDLSGGQKQRVVIARALINKPSIIFADEPTGNLDTATGAKIEDILFTLNKEKGISLIIVTHDQDLAMRCDRQIYIKDGEIMTEIQP
ncbi:MAG: ABC transporter ATP-binding protein [Candidatus Saccharibacteria bacterium]